jgi:hypothetical protein
MCNGLAIGSGRLRRWAMVRMLRRAADEEVGAEDDVLADPVLVPG